MGGRNIAINVSVCLLSVCMCMSMCLSVCLLAYLNTTHRNFTKFSVHCYVWSWLGPPYVLPILWMTSCFHIMERIGHNQRRRVWFVQFARWLHRGRSLPSPTVSRSVMRENRAEHWHRRRLGAALTAYIQQRSKATSCCSPFKWSKGDRDPVWWSRCEYVGLTVTMATIGYCPSIACVSCFMLSLSFMYSEQGLHVAESRPDYPLSQRLRLNHVQGEFPLGSLSPERWIRPVKESWILFEMLLLRHKSQVIQIHIISLSSALAWLQKKCQNCANFVYKQT